MDLSRAKSGTHDLFLAFVFRVVVIPLAITMTIDLHNAHEEMTMATATATVSGQRAGSLGIAAFQLGMEGRQRRAHELRDLALCRDAIGIERAREPRLPGRQQLMHVADVLYLK